VFLTAHRPWTSARDLGVLKQQRPHELDVRVHPVGVGKRLQQVGVQQARPRPRGEVGLAVGGCSVLDSNVIQCTCVYRSTLTRVTRNGNRCEPCHTVIVHDRTPENGPPSGAKARNAPVAAGCGARAPRGAELLQSLSLRQVTRTAGIVPTAFYRHFDDMEELRPRPHRRVVPHAAGDDPGGAGGPSDIRARDPQYRWRFSSATCTSTYTHFRFIARERFGGWRRCRHAIPRRDQAVCERPRDGPRALPPLSAGAPRISSCSLGLWSTRWSRRPRRLLDAPPEDPAAEADIIATAKRQLRMIVLGVPAWRSSQMLSPR